MTDHPSRRSFIGSAGSLAAVMALPRVRAADVIQAPFVRRSTVAQPVAISSANSLAPVTRTAELVLQGTDTLDAAVEGVKIQELDPKDDSVGYGGLPNADGVVQLDCSCMHGPTRRAGAVGALEGIKTPSEVARLVLKYTNHILLVGEGAKKFALSYGLKEEDLLTPESRQKWLVWRANRGPDDDFLQVPDNEPMVVRPTGTINLNVVNPAGDISSITTTSGLAWKIPGTGRRFSDRGRRPVHRQRSRCRGIHRARRVEHHGLRRIPDGGRNATRPQAHRCLPGDAQAHRGDVTLPADRRERASHFRAHVLCGEQEGRIRLGVDVSGQVCGA